MWSILLGDNTRPYAQSLQTSSGWYTLSEQKETPGRSLVEVVLFPNDSSPERPRVHQSALSVKYIVLSTYTLTLFDTSRGRLPLPRPTHPTESVHTSYLSLSPQGPLLRLLLT